MVRARTGTLTGEPDFSSAASDERPPRGQICSAPDKTEAIVEVDFDSGKPEDATAKAVYDDLRTLRSDRLEIEFTGDRFG